MKKLVKEAKHEFGKQEPFSGLTSDFHHHTQDNNQTTSPILVVTIHSKLLFFK